MPRSPVPYKRLRGLGTTLLQHIRLYQGPDHYLQITSTGYSESYRRFYFQDIQAILIQRHRGFEVQAVVTVGLMLFCLALALVLGIEGAVVFGGLSGLLGVLLVVHWILGPTCRCYIQTAVQTERLRSLGRMKRARALVNLTRSLLAAESAAPSKVPAPEKPAAQPGASDPPNSASGSVASSAT
jgi:hypothetical protein